MKTEDLLKMLKEYVSQATVHMYIIERKLREDKKLKDLPSIKFEYIPLQVNLSEDLASIVSKMLAKVIEMKFNNDIELSAYQVIDDEVEKIYTYKDLDRISGFKEFLRNKLGGEIKPLNSLKEISELEKSWAICYGFYHQNMKKWLFCIKKLGPSKMTVELETTTSFSEAIKHGFTSLFDTKTKTLKPFNGFSLNIEPSIDMIYLEEDIYIFRKKAFEDLTSLTEEFEEVAEKIVEEVKEIKFVKGLEYISEIIASRPSFRNKLIKAKEIGNIDFLKKCTNIKKEFERTGKKLSIKFSFDKSGKIIATSNEDAENIIKVLCEFYKEGVFAGKIFESPAGKVKI